MAELTEKEFGKKKGKGGAARVKKKVEVKINGQISATNEPFHCTVQLYVSPLSLE